MGDPFLLNAFIVFFTNKSSSSLLTGARVSIVSVTSFFMTHRADPTLNNVHNNHAVRDVKTASKVLKFYEVIINRYGD